MSLSTVVNLNFNRTWVKGHKVWILPEPLAQYIILCHLQMKKNHQSLYIFVCASESIFGLLLCLVSQVHLHFAAECNWFPSLQTLFTHQFLCHSSASIDPPSCYTWSTGMISTCCAHMHMHWMCKCALMPHSLYHSAHCSQCYSTASCTVTHFSYIIEKWIMLLDLPQGLWALYLRSNKHQMNE